MGTQSSLQCALEQRDELRLKPVRDLTDLAKSFESFSYRKPGDLNFEPLGSRTPTERQNIHRIVKDPDYGFPGRKVRNPVGKGAHRSILSSNKLPSFPLAEGATADRASG